MNENEPIEQPDVPENKKKPAHTPSDFGYRRFEAGSHREALLRARAGRDIEGEEEAKRLEAELAGADGGAKKILKPNELKSLDESVRSREEDKKAPKKEQEAKERQAFMRVLKTLQENSKFSIRAEDANHLFDFKGMTKDGKDMQSNETEKMLEHVDQGGDIPPNVEFHFHTAFKKGREDTEVVDVDYRVALHQIMRDGLETTLSSLLTLSYAAASSYDARSAKMAAEGGKVEVEKPKEKTAEGPLEDMKKQLEQDNIQVATIQTGQWNALSVSLPGKQKQVSIVYNGAVFQVTEKRQDKTVEVPVRTPSEILQYIEKESK